MLAARSNKRMGTEKVKKEEVVQRSQLDNKSPIQVPPGNRSSRKQPVWMVVRIRAKMAQRKKLAWPLRSSQLLLAVERLVANDGWVTSRVKAVSRRRRGPQARLYRACHPAILDHRGRRLTPATLLPPPSMRGFTPPVTTGAVMEVTKWLKPPVSVSRYTVTARVCRP